MTASIATVPWRSSRSGIPPEAHDLVSKCIASQSPLGDSAVLVVLDGTRRNASLIHAPDAAAIVERALLAGRFWLVQRLRGPAAG
jgi:hypothetical protein